MDLNFVDPSEAPVPPDELLTYTASAAGGVTLLENTCLNHRYALPNKLFEYLAAGLPVLASDLPAIRQVVEPFDVGLVVNPHDRPALIRAIRRLLFDGADRARWSANTSRVLEVYSWEVGSALFAETYNALLPPSSHRR